MLQKESAHNIFRLLMCRDLNLHQLKGVIFDHSCDLDQYLLNHEPREFEYLRSIVDGSHWSGHKRLRKPDISGKGGHLGCSSGFNTIFINHTFLIKPISKVVNRCRQF
jgi:hypothetical protein